MWPCKRKALPVSSDGKRTGVGTVKFTISQDGLTKVRELGGPRTLAEVLTREERIRVREGSLVAVDHWGTPLDLTSLLPEHEVAVEIELRRPQPIVDARGFGVPVNAAGEIVSLAEWVRIRDFEARCGHDLFDQPLGEIRRLVAANAQEHT